MMPFHHAQKIVQALLPALVHLTVPKASRERVGVGCKRGEMGGLHRHEFTDVLAEVLAGGLLDATDARAELNDVEIEFEHAVFAKQFLQPPSKHSFL